AQTDQRKAALQALAVQVELEAAFAQRLVDVAVRLPGAAIPHHHRAAAILALRNGALEGAVLDRMVLDVDREPLVGGIEARPLRNGPAQQRTVMLEPEIEMRRPRRVLLDQVTVSARRLLLGAGRLRRAGKIPLGAILAQAV